jgi:sterol desaturase/sphingolipid hydroxylase (fatty acid hydroxylase superfamily)
LNAKYITLAIPFFFLAIAVEIFVSRRQGAKDRFRFPDSITSLSCGVGQQTLAPLVKLLTLGAYVALFEHARVYTASATSVVAWVVLFFAVDCAYYFFHRASHRVNIVWAGHVVHHQSEEYNLTTALRQGWVQSVTAQVFYWPLAVLGFPLGMFVTMSTMNTLYQFWIHTRTITTMGPLEWVMNTPSHHRVHHGANPKYLDKNYAGVLIIWDRMFGTFQEEEEEPVYGTVKPLASFNPLWANVEYYVEIARIVRGSTTLREKLYAVIAPPEWRPRAMGGEVAIPETTRATQRKYDAPAPRGLAAYVAVNFAIVAGASGILLADLSTASMGLVALVAVFVVASLTAWGALFEGRRWGLALEVARLALAAAAIVWFARRDAWILPAAAMLGAIAFAVWVTRYRGHFARAEVAA